MRYVLFIARADNHVVLSYSIVNLGPGGLGLLRTKFKLVNPLKWSASEVPKGKNGITSVNGSVAAIGLCIGFF